MTKTEHIQALRDLANFLEQRDFPENWIDKDRTYGYNRYPPVSLYLFTKDKQLFGQCMKAIGTCTKNATEGYLEIRRVEPTFSIEINANRSQVCEKVIVGKKVIPSKPEEIIPAEPEKEVDIVEWKCPESFLALAGGDK